jgi:hypothetical protein
MDPHYWKPVDRSFYIWRKFLSALKMKIVLRLVALTCLTGLPLIGGLFAQGGPPVGGPPPCWPPPCIPVDGGLSLLIGAGVLLGAKRSYDLHKRSKQAA